MAKRQPYKSMAELTPKEIEEAKKNSRALFAHVLAKNGRNDLIEQLAAGDPQFLYNGQDLIPEETIDELGIALGLTVDNVEQCRNRLDFVSSKLKQEDLPTVESFRSLLDLKDGERVDSSSLFAMLPLSTKYPEISETIFACFLYMSDRVDPEEQYIDPKSIDDLMARLYIEVEDEV